MKRIVVKTTFLTIFFLLFFSCSKGQIKEAVDGQKPTKLTNEQAKLIFNQTKNFPNNTQLSIALIDGNQVKYYGIKRTADTLQTVENENSVFEIGSISKVFTSTLLAHLVIEGELELSEKISGLVDFEIATKENITLEQLANHSSGLPRLPSNLNLMMVDQSNPYKNYGPVNLKSYLSETFELNSTPGETYAYSNLGAGLLGYLLTVKSGLSYEELLQNYIARVLEMQQTTTDKTLISKQLVKGLNAAGQTTSNWDLNVLVGAGGILSSTQDLVKFARAQFNQNNEALALSRKPTFSANSNMDLGLGWHILKRSSNETWYWHNGGTGGYTSSMTLDTEKKRGVIILSNVSAFNLNQRNIDQLGFQLLQGL